MARFNTATIENTSYSMLAKCKQMLMGGGKNTLLVLSCDLFSHLCLFYFNHSNKSLNFLRVCAIDHTFSNKYIPALICRG
jgi:hypothetical protein